MEPFLGEIKLVPFNFMPFGFAFCDGRILSISQNTALFSLIGTTYGGDGISTFALPDLRSRVAVHTGPNNPQGEVSGSENVTVNMNQMPAHVHNFNVHSASGTVNGPSNQFPGSASAGLGDVYAAPPTNVTMNPNSLSSTGGTQPHSNIQPYLVLNYVIALQGIYPTRN
jgi:microcystin-dependent protein